MNEEKKQEQNSESRELGTKPIAGLFVKYSFLTLVGMLAQGVMVMFEGIIIGRGLGEMGLACVGLIMPLEYFMLALGGFFAIGVSTLAAMKLGDGDEEGARKVYGQGLWFSFIVIMVISIVIFIFAGSVAGLLGATPDLFDSIVLFIRVFMVGYPFCIIGHIAVYMARVDEKPSIATWAMTLSAVLALVWLYASVFLFKLGIAGCAGYYASSIGIWGFFILYFFFSKNTIFKVRMSDLKFDSEIIGNIVKIGFPYLLVQASSTVFTIVLNNFLGKFGGELDIAAFAVINGYVVYILMMITQSTTGGLQPIASYNFGAKMYDRVMNLIKVGIVGNLIAVYALAIVFWILATPVCTLFIGAGSELIPIAAKYTRVVISCTALGLTANLTSGYFQAVERVVESTVLGICRYIIFGIPAIFIMANMMGVTGVWFSQPVSDILSFVLSLVLVTVEMKRLKKMKTA